MCVYCCDLDEDQIWWPIYAEIQEIPKGLHEFLSLYMSARDKNLSGQK
jgi:hypothetical protein